MHFDARPTLVPDTIIYGCEMPNIGLRSDGGRQTYFCHKNRNLHLTEADFPAGTYEAGRLLGALCEEFCVRKREADKAFSAPCPALVSSYMVGTENRGLATVELRPTPQWSLCPGAQLLLDTTQTKEERYFLETYLGHKYVNESPWRKDLVEQWNESWQMIEEGFLESTRRERFEQMLWKTLRFPALIPQVWLNRVARSEEHAKMLDENPSRVDFMAFYHGEGHIIEIDGPSHYADWDGQTYKIDEQAYARNLRIERSLRRSGWHVTRIGRSEVRDAMSEFHFGAPPVIKVLPFWSKEGYPSRPTLDELGVGEIDTIPF